MLPIFRVYSKISFGHTVDLSASFTIFKSIRYMVTNAVDILSPVFFSILPVVFVLTLQLVTVIVLPVTKPVPAASIAPRLFII